MKNTSQRYHILQCLEGMGHATVDDIYTCVQQHLPHIGKATVYQNLRQMTDHGLVREVDVKGVARFELDQGNHHHLICQKCGKIDDFYNEELSTHALESVQQKGFAISSASVMFYGLCNDCKTEGKNV